MLTIFVGVLPRRRRLFFSAKVQNLVRKTKLYIFVSSPLHAVGLWVCGDSRNDICKFTTARTGFCHGFSRVRMSKFHNLTNFHVD